MLYFCVCILLGSEASFIVAVKQLKRYPVDLYYLVDVSASMQENLDHVGVSPVTHPFRLSYSVIPGLTSVFNVFLFSCSVPVCHPLSVSVSTSYLTAVQLKTVGVALSLRMIEHSSDLWLGFGSFVDKPVSPYINVHPSKINNPCR